MSKEGKSLKKILALILSFAIALSFGTVYAEQHSEALPNSPDMVFATSLGILDEYLEQTSPLTRIELASVFYNIMMYGSQPEMNNSAFFSDVGFENAAYADFAYQCGIMNGVGDGRFDPDSQVTYAQVIKTIVAFLGYTEHANAQGGYPYGYLAIAQRIGLIDSMPPSIDSVITINKLASMLRLATNVPLMQRITFGTDYVKYEADKGSDYLSTYMDITRIRGRVTANYLADLEGGEALSYGQVKIEDTLFNITEASNDIVSCLGYEVDIYVKDYKETKAPSIVYYELTNTNNIVVIDGENVKGISSGRIEYSADEKDKYAKISSVNTRVIYNGSLATSYDNSIINPFENSSLEGEVRLIDNNSDGTYDVVIVDAYSSYIVKSIVDNMIFNEFVPSEVVDLGKDFEDGDIEITNVLGQPIKLSEIEAGDVINVSRDIKGNPKRIVVTIDTYIGTLSGINTSDNIIDVGGYEFKASKNLISDPSLKLGSKVTLYFNKGGKVCDIRPSDAKFYIGYLVDRRPVSGLDTEYMLRIFTSGGVFEDLTLAKKVKLSVSNETVSAAKAYAALPTDANGSVRQPVLYTIDDEGAINWIDWCNGTEPRDGLYMIEGFNGTSQTLAYRSSQYNFGGKLLISASTVIFNVPKDDKPSDYDNYYIETTSYYGGDNSKKTIDFAAYSVDKDGSPCASILVDKDGIKTSVPTSANLFVVDSISTVFDPELGECYKINGWDYSSGIKSMIVEKQVVDAVYTDALPVRGDIMQTRSVGGAVTVVKKLFNFDEKEFATGSNPSHGDFLGDIRCVYGEVIYNDGSYIKVQLENSSEVLAFPISSAKFVEVDFGRAKDGVVSKATVDKLYDTKAYPTYPSKVVVRTNKGSVRTVVIYNGLGGVN